LLFSSSWLLLFITSAVALGTASEEAGSKSHPYHHLLRKSLPNTRIWTTLLVPLWSRSEPVGR
jgi:hypothetical protein